MENNKLPSILDTAPPEPTTDLSPVDLEKVAAYVEAGLPGLYQVKEESVERMMELYLEGKPYTQISRVLKIDRTLIMYMAQKFDWYMARKGYQHELAETIKQRVVDSKLNVQDDLLQLIHVYRKKLGKKAMSYLATNDESHAEAIDGKDVALLLKLTETLYKLSSDQLPGKAGTPAVGLNLGDGVTVTKTGENTVEITPNSKEKAVADMIKQFADARREAERSDKK